jgi:hypothetical protein
MMDKGSGYGLGQQHLCANYFTTMGQFLLLIPVTNNYLIFVAFNKQTSD